MSRNDKKGKEGNNKKSIKKAFIDLIKFFYSIPSMFDQFVSNLINNKSKLHNVLVILCSGVFSMFAVVIANDITRSIIYTLIILLVSIITETSSTNSLERLIKDIRNCRLGFIYVLLFLLAVAPTIVGCSRGEMMCYWVEISFDNLAQNICGAAIVCFILKYLSKFNNKEIIYSLLKFKEDFFRLFFICSFNIAFLNAVNYQKNETLMSMLNTVYLTVIVFVGMLSVCTFALRLIVNRPLDPSIKHVYPLWTLVPMTLFILSYGLPPTHRQEWILLIADTFSLNSVAWFFFVFIYRRSYKTHPRRPWFWWILFSIFTIGSVIYVCMDEGNVIMQSYLMMGGLIFAVTLVLLLYINQRQMREQQRRGQAQPKSKIGKRVKIALITGVTGHDGISLADFLLEKDYVVYGIARRSSGDSLKKIAHLMKNPHFKICYGNITNSSGITKIIADIRPDEIYNLAGKNCVQASFDNPEYYADVNAIGSVRILEAVRKLKLEKSCKIFQASTAEIYGYAKEFPKNESTPFHPYSPYAAAKQYAFWIARTYREVYGFFATNGILFDHVCETFEEISIFHSIIMAAVDISQNRQEKLSLASLDDLYDWGYARDYIECMWLSLQQDFSDDFVIATGEQHSVRELCELAFKAMKMEIEWQGKGLDEKGKLKGENRIIVEIISDSSYTSDTAPLIGDPSKAEDVLGWNPTKTPFEEMVKLMVEYYIKNKSGVCN